MASVGCQHPHHGVSRLSAPTSWRQSAVSTHIMASVGCQHPPHGVSRLSAPTSWRQSAASTHLMASVGCQHPPHGVSRLPAPTSWRQSAASTHLMASVGCVCHISPASSSRAAGRQLQPETMVGSSSPTRTDVRRDGAVVCARCRGRGRSAVGLVRSRRRSHTRQVAPRYRCRLDRRCTGDREPSMVGAGQGHLCITSLRYNKRKPNNASGSCASVIIYFRNFFLIIKKNLKTYVKHFHLTVVFNSRLNKPIPTLCKATRSQHRKERCSCQELIP